MFKKPLNIKSGEELQLSILSTQNQIVMKAIHNKMRNLTKKISEIEQLQKRKTLNSQQKVKINNKSKVNEQMSKYQEFKKFYQDTISQNKERIIECQKTNLLRLGEAFAIYNAGQGPANQQIVAIYNAITSHSSRSIQQRVNKMQNLLNQFCDNKQNQQWIQKHKNTLNQSLQPILQYKKTDQQNMNLQIDSISNKEGVSNYSELSDILLVQNQINPNSFVQNMNRNSSWVQQSQDRAFRERYQQPIRRHRPKRNPEFNHPSTNQYRILQTKKRQSCQFKQPMINNQIQMKKEPVNLQQLQQLRGQGFIVTGYHKLNKNKQINSNSKKQYPKKKYDR